MFRSAVLACLLFASGAAATAAPKPSGRDAWPRVLLGSPGGTYCVRQALEGAARRLAHARCQQLFSEFTDERRRPLAARLLELDITAAGYLPLVVFADGSESTQCRVNGSLFAFTSRGSRVVFICERRFERAWHQNRARAEAVLIHEVLHTLGLGENPPTSFEITKRVQFLCSN